MGSEQIAPQLLDLHEARRLIANDVVATPLLRSDVLDDAVQARLFVKAESLQVTGAFKIRGAFNRLRRFSAEERQGGVVTYSSGNHGQAIAAAAKRLGMPAVILMPRDSVATKVDLTRAQGGEIVFFQRGVEDAIAMGEALAARRGATIVPPANDVHIIAGQGTVGLEILSQMWAQGAASPDALFVPCGSGGLTAGCAIAFKEHCPDAQVFAVEPENFDDTRRSLEQGARVTIETGRQTICDALTARTPAPLTFAINLAAGVQALTVSDDDVTAAMAFAFRHLKLVLEPGGAAGLAAVLADKVDVKDKTVAIVCSGGNVDAPLFARAIFESGGRG